MQACDFASPDPCLPGCNALHCNALQVKRSDGGASREDEDDAAAAAPQGMRELRLVVADARSRAVRRRVTKQGRWP